MPKTTLHPHVFPTCCRVAPLPLPSLPHMLLQQQRRVPPNSSNTSPVHEFCLMQGHPACRFCRTRFYDSNDPPNQATPHSRVRHDSCRATPPAVSAAPASTTATTCTDTWRARTSTVSSVAGNAPPSTCTTGTTRSWKVREWVGEEGVWIEVLRALKARRV